MRPILNRVETENALRKRLRSGEDGFAVITQAIAVDLMVKRIKSRFSTEILEYYLRPDRERGDLIIQDESGKEQKVPLMRVAVGKVSAKDFFNRGSSTIDVD